MSLVMLRPLQKKRYNAILVTLVCYGPLLVLFGGLTYWIVS